MNLALTTRRVAETKVRLADIVSAGVQFRSPYLDISKRTNEAIPAKLPMWARQYLRGYADALLERLHRDTDFRYLIDGEWINARDLTSEQMPIAADGAPQCTFWKGTDRVFYQSVDHIYGRAGA